MPAPSCVFASATMSGLSTEFDLVTPIVVGRHPWIAA
jgi:hypothetical protein